jgi:glyoxylase-like metal-dependent hydrolase (beta-lactamase superfamily II)
MTIRIDVLEMGRIILDGSLLLRGRPSGSLRTVLTHAFLICGAGTDPILVDTGFRDPVVLERIGMAAEMPDGCDIDTQLGRYGVTRSDVGMVILTHLHVDHAGNASAFPMTTPMVVNRREMEFAAGGVQGLSYAPEDMHHMLDRMYTPGAETFLDLKPGDSVEVAPGVTCELAGGHTPGMMFVRIQTDDGVATICTDVIYSVQDQLVAPMQAGGAWEPLVSNMSVMSLEEEKAAIRRALQGTTFLLPSHCGGARLEHGRVTGFLDGCRIPGAHTPLDAAPEAARR